MKRQKTSSSTKADTLLDQVGGFAGAYNIACRLHRFSGFFLWRPFTRKALARKATIISNQLNNAYSIQDLVDDLTGVPVSKEEISATGRNLDRYTKTIIKLRRKDNED